MRNIEDNRKFVRGLLTSTQVKRARDEPTSSYPMKKRRIESPGRKLRVRKRKIGIPCTLSLQTKPTLRTKQMKEPVSISIENITQLCSLNPNRSPIIATTDTIGDNPNYHGFFRGIGRDAIKSSSYGSTTILLILDLWWTINRPTSSRSNATCTTNSCNVPCIPSWK